MIARALLAIILSGIVAGLVMGVVQHVRLTPMILQAETYEAVDGHDHASHTHDNATHSHAAIAWSPADGLERTFFTILTTALVGAGFAALLAGVALVTGRNITPANGWMWGLCGFFAVAFAPAIGLPPELPGLKSVSVSVRQSWWVLTIFASAAGLWLLAYKRNTWAIMAAFALLLAPHVIGAPTQPPTQSQLPAEFAASFTTLSLGANALMWLVIGTLLGFVLPRNTPEHIA